MATEVLAAETAVAEMIASSYVPTATASAPEVTIEADKFEFDEGFQRKVLTHLVRDQTFARQAAHLLKPEYFEDVGVAALANVAIRHFNRWGTVLTELSVAKEAFREARLAKLMRDDVLKQAVEALRDVFSPDADISNREMVAERVAEFARHQAVSEAIYRSVDLLSKKNFTKIEELIRSAVDVGINADSGEYDYFERLEERTKERKDKAAGLMPPAGISTGYKMLDDLLYHRGWGRRELSILLGGPKSGKTTGLINFARVAALSGKNVLYVTLEVAAKIISDRLDASIADTMIKELGVKINEVHGKVAAVQSRSGKLKMHEYPSGTFTPNMLRQLIERYKSPALQADGSIRPPIQFDLIIVDYADIMAPNHRTTDAIENSKSIYLDLRAIAFEENVAMLSATQGNREGSKATVMTGVHVADDYNKVRTVDLMISINVTDEERANGEARLHFAASRNQEGGITVFVKQDLAKMKFIEHILRIE